MKLIKALILTIIILNNLPLKARWVELRESANGPCPPRPSAEEAKEAEELFKRKFEEERKRKLDEKITPLLEAAAYGKIEEIKNILATNPDISVNSQNSAGLSALSAAIQNDQFNTVKYLLSIEGINPNIKDNVIEFTPLMWAVLKGNKKIVQELLKANADPKIKDKSNVLPIQMAKKYDYWDIAELLEKAK